MAAAHSSSVQYAVGRADRDRRDQEGDEDGSSTEEGSGGTVAAILPGVVVEVERHRRSDRDRRGRQRRGTAHGEPDPRR